MIHLTTRSASLLLMAYLKIAFISFSLDMTTLCGVEFSARDFSCLIRLAKCTAEYLICRHGYLIMGQSAQSEKRNTEHQSHEVDTVNNSTTRSVTNKQHRVCGVTVKTQYKA